MIKGFRLDQLDSSIKDKEKRFEIDQKNLVTLMERLPKDKKAGYIKKLSDINSKFTQEKRMSMEKSLTYKKSTAMIIEAHALLLKNLRKAVVADILQTYEEAITLAQKNYMNEKEQINSILTANLSRKLTLGRKKKDQIPEEVENK
eukprot:NODE_339_length_9219_cov_0.924232.p7 type:complete len:146 gc:universal NODE_339_length_9219_cov_0.924232:4740-5177(+)